MINTYATLVDDILFDFVYDPTYPFTVNIEIMKLLEDKHVLTRDSTIIDNNTVHCVRHELTCYYVFGDKDNVSLRKLLDNFKLMD